MNNGIFQCTISLFGGGVGPILATQLLLFTTWRKVFWLVGIPGLVVAAFMWFIIREPVATAANAGGGKRPRVCRSPGYSDTGTCRSRWSRCYAR